MIELIATTESLEQGLKILDSGADCVVTGEEVFGLRLPGYLTDDEIDRLIKYAHASGKKVIVAANAILHNDKMAFARDYLKRMKALNVDKLLVGDTGLIQIMKDPELYIPYIYDASVLTTSSGQVNFWKNYGAVAALIAQEVPCVELELLVSKAELPVVTRVYGAHCIQQSKRKLLDNYFNFIEKNPVNFEDRHLFISEPGKDETHYSIYQDSHGTHVFATNDLHLMNQLPLLAEIKAEKWYLDGIYTPGEDFVTVVKAYDHARKLLETDKWTAESVSSFDETVKNAHPHNRELDTGFFLYTAEKVQ